MSDQSSVSLSPMQRDSLANLLSHLEDGNATGLLAIHETEETTGDSLWKIYALSSDHLWYRIESIKIVSAFRKQP